MADPASTLTVLVPPERSISTPGTPLPQNLRPQRVLACVLCQQRKIKCNRKIPCANCIKSRAQCVPATLATRRQRRKHPERELLDRVRKYEILLRQNNIKFEPLSNDPTGEKGPVNPDGVYDSDDENAEAAGADWPTPSTTIKSDRPNILRDLYQRVQDPENDSDFSQDDESEVLSEIALTKAWDQLYEDNDHLLFGMQKPGVDLSALHPEPAQIFRLWQIYLENVNPLLKVTHTPSLQGRIVDAVSNVKDINPNLEALIFSIYCTAILSLEDGVEAMFGSSKEDLISRFQFGCRQALLNCGLLRCDDRDCLTALYLYLVSVRIKTVPRSLSSMLGVAIRIAERMGIHSESDLTKCGVLEAEMRRRLWWSLVLFDTRINEMAKSNTFKLGPTWDCRVPLNVNDSDLRVEMKEPPQEALGKSSEALFAVVRSVMGDFVRNTMFYLDFTAPALKPIAKDVQKGPIPGGGELVNLEKMIENKYLKFCDSENPLHFMTIWSARAFLAKCRLAEHHSKYSGTSLPTEAQRDTAISHALNMLECDTKLMKSPLTKGFLWQVLFHFPFPGYIQIVQNLRGRVITGQAEKAWAIMNDNYEARFGVLYTDKGPFFKIFAKIILQAWEARELALRQLGQPLTPPRFVSFIRDTEAQTSQSIQNDSLDRQPDAMGMGLDDILMSMPMDFGSHTFSLGSQASYAEMGPGVYPHMPGQISLDVGVNYLNWSAMNWSSMNERAGRPESTTQQPGQTSFDADLNQIDLLDGLGFGEWPLGR